MGSRKPRGASVEVAGGMINIARNVFFIFVFYFTYFVFVFFFFLFATYGLVHTRGAAFRNTSYQQVAKIRMASAERK